MMLLWNIRYFDRTQNDFKDRLLCLDTKTLDPVSRAAIELVAEDNSSKRRRDILKFRGVFKEEDWKSAAGTSGIVDSFRMVGPLEYFEDETGAEISLQEVAAIVTGDPNARMAPQGARQHDIDLMLAKPKPTPVAEVTLDPEKVRLLGYFTRDLREMQESAFMKDGPGSLKSVGNIPMTSASEPVLETVVTDDEIRSFATIFRRLYMKSEPANFTKAVDLYVKVLGDHPYAKWVAGVFSEYEIHLEATPDLRPLIQSGACTFTSKRLIDVFLYTQYSHQPGETRQRQFEECLSQVHGKRNALTWMFLREIFKCSLEIGKAGRVIAAWFKQYCDHHKVVPDVLESLRHDHTGLGVAEKDEERWARLFREKTEALANELWKQDGSPEGGHSQFIVAAREQLSRALDFKKPSD